MSKITLEPNSSGAGTFSIVSPDSNTNRIITLPDENGSLITDANTIPLTLMPSGSIIDMKFDFTTATATFSSSSEINITEFPFDGNFFYTPNLSNSRLLVQFQVHAGHKTTWRSTGLRLYYQIGGNSGTWTQVTGGSLNTQVYLSGTNGGGSTFNQQFLMSSLNTTNDVFFKVTYQGHENGRPLHLNKSTLTDTQSDINETSVSSNILIQEVKQ